MTSFSHEIRALLCSNCGAPLEVSVAGGDFVCGYCGTTNRVVSRDERADIQQAEQAPPMGESERLGHLRAQDASPQPLPAGLEGLLVGTEIPSQRVAEAMAQWQTLRQQVAYGAAFPDQDRLFYLTVLLAPAVEERTRRALIESVLELLPDVRHRHVLRCSLAEYAVLAGDVAAAREWLRPCNPRPTDLRMDTAYRIAMACLAAAERNPHQILAQLGSSPGEIPLVDDSEANAMLLHADAVERTSGPEAAAEQLTAQLHRDLRRLDKLQRATRELASLSLCPQSGEAAIQTVWRAVEDVLRPSPEYTRNQLKGFFVIPLGALVAAILAWMGYFDDDMGAGIAITILVFLVAVPVGLILNSLNDLERDLRLRDHGVLTTASLVSSERSVSTTGATSTVESTSTVYQKLELRIVVGDKLHVVSKKHKSQDPIPFGSYPCLVDPDDPQSFELRIDPLSE